MNVNADSVLLEAVSLAARVHEGQYRKDKITPYAAHPFRVCLIVRDIFGCDDRRMLLAALLHDTIEDSSTDFDDLAEKFGPEVAEWVGMLSKDKRLPEDAREDAYCQALAAAPWQVKACKLGDMFDNLQDMATFSAEQRQHSLQRVTAYLQVLQKNPPAELNRPLHLVRELVERVSAPSAQTHAT